MARDERFDWPAFDGLDKKPVTMLTLRRLLFASLITRRFVSSVTLALYAGMVFGVPLPAAARKSTAEAYPCMFSACGCMSAEQCWKSCCCTTLEQRLAWAAERGITLPGYAERPPSRGCQTTPRRERETAPKKACCSSAPVKKSCCEESESKPSCCSTDETEPETPSTKSAAPAPKSAGFVLGIAAQKCQGLTSLWSAAGQAPVPPAWAAWAPQLDAVGRVVSSALSSISQPSVPALRPPRG